MVNGSSKRTKDELLVRDPAATDIRGVGLLHRHHPGHDGRPLRLPAHTSPTLVGSHREGRHPFTLKDD